MNFHDTDTYVVTGQTLNKIEAFVRSFDTATVGEIKRRLNEINRGVGHVTVKLDPPPKADLW